LMRVRSLI
jgi:Fe2+-dicitrate sensor, membrane component